MSKHSTRHSGFLRGLIFGLVIGLVCTAAAGSWAAMGKGHWEERNWHFQVGYLAGFLDVIRIVQARNPNTALAKEFKVPPRVPPHVWLGRVNELYEEEEHKERPLTQVIIIAGDRLAAERGYVYTPGGAAGFEALHRFMMERNRRIVEQAADGDPPEEDAGSDDAP